LQQNKIRIISVAAVVILAALILLIPALKRWGSPSTPVTLVPCDLTNSIGMRFCRVPAGEFMMGAIPGDDLAEEDEKPQHLVRITEDFLIGQLEVTQEQYERVLGHNPAWFQPQGDGARQVASLPTTRQLPVEMVSWSDAVLFCRVLSEFPEEQAAGRTYRLPTEAEWEFACRAGTTTRFSFGPSFDGEQANMDRVMDRPVQGGRYPPNSLGLYDMHGNVLEWCSNWHSDSWYQESPKEDPLGPPEPDGDFHVLRGGGWKFPAASCSFRDRIMTSLRGSSHGFRVVCEFSAPDSTGVSPSENSSGPP